MKKMRGLCLSILLISAALAWVGVARVQAHAMLMRSVPDANASLASAPSLVELYFSEGIDPRLSKITVLDASGARVDAGDVRLDPQDATHILVSLKPLVDGVYTVAWKAISATDGHQTSGSYPFAVGNVAPSAMGSAQMDMAASPSVPLGDAVTKGLLYLAAAALVGSVLFTFLVWNPSIRRSQVAAEGQAYHRLAQWLALAALGLLLAADLVNLMAQAGQADGTLFGMPWQPPFITLLLETRIGALAIARAGLAFLLAGLLLPRPNRWNRWVGLAGGLLLLLTFSLESHAAADPFPTLPVLVDWVHMIAVSVWVGGLFSFLGAMWVTCKLALEVRTRLTAQLIPHFSTLALTSVGLLTATGVYAALLRIGTLDALLHTAYGQAFIVKGLIGFPMVALGGVNFLYSSPTMQRFAGQPGGNPGLVNRFRKLLGGEVFLGILILVWVAVFTSMPPARVMADLPGFNQTTHVNDLTVSLNISPNRPGINHFMATITSGGKPVTDAQSVSLEINSLDGMVPAATATLVGQGDGSYALTGGYLGMAGKWDIKTVVVRSGKFDAYGDFKMDNTPVVTQPIPWHTVSVGLLVVTALCLVMAAFVLVRLFQNRNVLVT